MIMTQGTHTKKIYPNDTIAQTYVKSKSKFKEKNTYDKLQSNDTVAHTNKKSKSKKSEQIRANLDQRDFYKDLQEI